MSDSALMVRIPRSAASGAQHGLELLADDNGSRPGIVEDVGQLGCRVGQAERDRHPARPPYGPLPGDVAPPRGDHEADPGAGKVVAPIEEGSGSATGQSQQLVVRVIPIGVDHGHGSAVGGGTSGQRRRTGQGLDSDPLRRAESPGAAASMEIPGRCAA